MGSYAVAINFSKSISSEERKTSSEEEVFLGAVFLSNQEKSLPRGR